MEFRTLTQDRETIDRKYHDPDKEFNAYARWAYHGYDYDPETGLDDEQIMKGLEKLAPELEGLPHPIQKAKLFSYVMDNNRIDVNEHDYFIGMYTWGRPIADMTTGKWNAEVRDAFPEATKVLKDQDDSGACYGGLDFDHTVPDWDSMMELGFPGLLARAERIYEEGKAIGKWNEKQEAFFRGMQLEYQALIRFIDRLYRYALTKDFEKAPKIAECLKHLRDGAPQNTYDALQLIYIYFMVSESIENYQVRSLGYGLDSTLWEFYQRDLANGTFTKAEVAERIGYFLMQWSAIGNYWGQPVYLGGMNVDGTAKVNELSYMVLDVYDQLGIYNPKIQIKINKATPKDFVCKALEMIRGGISSIVFCNDEHIIKSLMSRGATYEEAVDSVISGCYEYKVKRRGIGIGCGYPSLLKPVSLVLDNGMDVLSGKEIGIKTGELEELHTFADFYHAYLEQLKYMLCSYYSALDQMQTRVAEVNPSLLFSATLPNCVETMTDALDGGTENDTGVTMSGIGTAVDALMAVHDLVYEKKLVTLAELKDALAKNWEGYEWLRAKALNLKRKYGNNERMTDSYAEAIARFVSNLVASMRNSHGGRLTLEFHSARAYIIHGEKTMATPDGRKLGEETSKNASPTPGADRNGITALINSVTHMDTALCNGGFCLDAMLHPSAVQGEAGLEAFYAILTTYMEKGGASIHFNVFDAKILRDAQEHPEKYQNLQVRICGWNALWNNLNKKEQDAYILRAENIQ